MLNILQNVCQILRFQKYIYYLFIKYAYTFKLSYFLESQKYK